MHRNGCSCEMPLLRRSASHGARPEEVNVASGAVAMRCSIVAGRSVCAGRMPAECLHYVVGKFLLMLSIILRPTYGPVLTLLPETALPQEPPSLPAVHHHNIWLTAGLLFVLSKSDFRQDFMPESFQIGALRLLLEKLFPLAVAQTPTPRHPDTPTPRYRVAFGCGSAALLYLLFKFSHVFRPFSAIWLHQRSAPH